MKVKDLTLEYILKLLDIYCKYHNKKFELDIKEKKKGE